MNATPAKLRGQAATLGAIRGILLAIFLLGALGAGAELLLLGHTEDYWQWIPLLLISLSLVAILIHTALRRAATVRIFQLTMILFVISGFVGVWLHYQAKMEFKLESNPDLAGLELFWEAVKGAAVPPVLAPGMMIQMGLLGLAWAYRHPALGEKNESTSTGV
ncbi:MAG: hypothetical protein ACREBD_21830 [Blastocatellia bacterium]